MRMDELDKKIRLLELSTKEREQRIDQMRAEQEQSRGQDNKGFLDGIKSYQVEDI